MYRLRLLLKNFNKRFYSSNTKFANLNEAARFFSPLLDLKEPTMYKYLAKNDFLLDLEPEDVRRKIAYFKYLNATNEDILEQPGLLAVHLITLENRTTTLRECGFVESLNLVTLSKYITLVRQRIKALKMYKFIPQDLNMVEQLEKQFEVSVSPDVVHNDDLRLQPLREIFLNDFLRKRLELTDEDFKKLWKSYSKIRHKSFGHTQRVVDILQYDYKFSRDKICANLYLLHADPENLLRYPDVVPSINDVDIREIMVKQPKIMMVQCDKVKAILEHLREREIDEAGVLKYSTILTLSARTVLARIEQLRKTKEFTVLFNHPRIIKLIAYQTKAAIRLDFLQQLKVRCASLNVLSSHSQSFEKYVRDGCDRTKGKDTAHYLNTVFNRHGNEAIDQLKRHPNWFHVPAVQMQETLDYLKVKGFTLDEIFENIQILLYPLTRINQKLDKLIECKQLKKTHEDFGIALTTATPIQLLSLCLYMVEIDFHFTGDGVWPEQIQHSDSTTTTNIELPRTLNKEYKYGKKPAEGGVARSPV